MIKFLQNKEEICWKSKKKNLFWTLLVKFDWLEINNFPYSISKHILKTDQKTIETGI